MCLLHSSHFDAIGLTEEQYKEKLRTSSTLYVGNLSFFTAESQLMELFSQCGQVVNLFMGLNRQTNKPCGFCFVEFAKREQAARAIDLLNRCSVDNKQIRVDWDYGFQPHRQFGRGPSGAQVRDDRRARDGLKGDSDRPVQAIDPATRPERTGNDRPNRGGYGGGRGDRRDNYRGGHHGGGGRDSYLKKRSRYGDNDNNQDDEFGGEDDGGNNDYGGGRGGGYKRRNFNSGGFRGNYGSKGRGGYGEGRGGYGEGRGGYGGGHYNNHHNNHHDGENSKIRESSQMMNNDQ